MCWIENDCVRVRELVCVNVWCQEVTWTGEQHLRASAVTAALPANIECREQSAETERGAGSTARKRELCYSTHSGLGGALTQRNLRRTILPGCCLQLAASHLLNMPLPREVGSGISVALDLPVPPHTAKESVVRIIATCNMFQRQADNQQLWVCVISYITRDREPQLAAGGC